MKPSNADENAISNAICSAVSVKPKPTARASPALISDKNIAGSRFQRVPIFSHILFAIRATSDRKPTFFPLLHKPECLNLEIDVGTSHYFLRVIRALSCARSKHLCATVRFCPRVSPPQPEISLCEPYASRISLFIIHLKAAESA